MSTQTSPGHMLLISLGPIQDFIDAARRCQDLWFGSWLLSDLARTVAETLETASAALGASSAKVVFPAGYAASKNGPEQPGVANIIFAVIKGNGIDPAMLAEKARKAMAERLRTIAELSFAKIQQNSRAKEYFHSINALRQIDGMMEFLWVSVPWDGSTSGNSYSETRKRVYARLASLKNTRTWGQPDWGPRSGVPKSSIDGLRESVIDEEAYIPEKDGGPGPAWRRRWYGTKSAERLCGVGLLKRLGQEYSPANEEDWESEGGIPFFDGYPRPPFHSTAHIAAIPTLQAIERAGAEGRAAVGRYLAVLEDIGLDLDRFRVPSHHPGQPHLPPIPVLRGIGGPKRYGYDGNLLFESRLPDHLTENTPEGRDRKVVKENARDASDHAARALRKLMKELGIGEPCPYYAFLLADGDNMGAAIDNIDALAHHEGIASALNHFAASCREIVCKHKGTLIFSGGDDVLALLPLPNAITCAQELHDAFGKGLKNYRTKDGKLPTLSVGIAISHAREPMSAARELAKRAEKEAKKHPGKDAICVLASKRSGGDLQIVGSWAPPSGATAVHERIQTWMEVLGEGELSAKTAHDLEAVAAHYMGLPPDKLMSTDRKAEATSLCKQVLARKRRSGGELRETVADKTRDPQEVLLSLLNEDRPVTESILQLSAELQIARLIQRATVRPPAPQGRGATDPTESP